MRLPGASSSPGSRHEEVPLNAIPRRYHVLLIGIDGYPTKPLKGCVNDIDAIERLLLDPPGIGVPVDRFRITRLAAPREGAASRSGLEARTRPPTRANILGALADLTGPAVTPEDRVLIYYSGHGGYQQTTARAWHESIVPVDEQHILDRELNAYLHAIAKTVGKETVDLTVVLDCCHASGTTRDAVAKAAEDERVALRSLAPSATPIPEPDLSQIPGAREVEPGGVGRRLRPVDPPYLVVAACQSDELAGEKMLDGVRQGNLTRALVERLRDRGSEARSDLRWADLWPGLLVDMRRIGNSAPATPAQNPWLTGRSERRVFGGPWERRDPGFAVTPGPEAGGFTVRAGRFMGLSVDAELSVYRSDQPQYFPPADSEADFDPHVGRLGRLRVVEAGPAESKAVLATGEIPFELPEGARACLAKAGVPDRLRVRLDPFEADTAAQLSNSGLLRVEADPQPDAEVTVLGDSLRGWTLGNEVEPRIAGVPGGRVDTLRLGLESYARYNQVLRLAQQLRAPNEAERLSIHLLRVDAGMRDFSDAVLDGLPEAPLGRGGDYDLPEGFPFCIAIDNHGEEGLNATVLNCTAGGKVEYLGAVFVHGRAREHVWLGSERGLAFQAFPSMGRLAATDRMVVVGTTRKDVSLEAMAVDENVQDLVDVQSRGETTRATRRMGRPAAPVELWTATTRTVRMYQGAAT